jgi:hypothetical protein
MVVMMAKLHARSPAGQRQFSNRPASRQSPVGQRELSGFGLSRPRG